MAFQVAISPRRTQTSDPRTGAPLVSPEMVERVSAAVLALSDVVSSGGAELAAHEAATGTAVHGLGTASTHAATDFDASGAAAGVQSNLDTHEAATGTAVHGLGSASTHAATDFDAAGTAATHAALTNAHGLSVSTVDIVVVTATTVKALSGGNAQFLAIAHDKFALSAFAVAVFTLDDSGSTCAVHQIIQGGDYSGGWLVSGLNAQLTSVGGGSNCRASFLQLR